MNFKHTRFSKVSEKSRYIQSKMLRGELLLDEHVKSRKKSTRKAAVPSVDIGGSVDQQTGFM